MMKSEFKPLNKNALAAVAKDANKKMNEVASKYNIDIKNLVDIIIKECKKLVAKNDAVSRCKLSMYRDMVIGKYSLFLIRLYNEYAKKYSLDANDLVHIPYEKFENFVKNYDENAGVNFYSFMMMSIRGYITKYILSMDLVKPNAALKIHPEYVGLTKTGSDGMEIEYLHTNDEDDVDVNGKIEFIESISSQFPNDIRELYKDMTMSKFPMDAYRLYSERNSCSIGKSKMICKKMKKIVKGKWNEYEKRLSK